MRIQASNGCGNLGNLGAHCNRHSIGRGWGLMLEPAGGFLIFLVQVKPEFLQRINFLILRIGVPALVNVVQLMDLKVMAALGNTSMIPFTIKHPGTAAVDTTTTTATPPAITMSGSVATGRICFRNITSAEFTAFC